MDGAGIAFRPPCIGHDDVVERGIGLAKTCESDLDHHPAKLNRAQRTCRGGDELEVTVMPNPSCMSSLPQKSPDLAISPPMQASANVKRPKLC